MCDALRDLMKDEIQEAVNEAVNEAVDEAHKAWVSATARNMIGRGYDDEEIAAITALPLDAIALERSNL
ncbi:MAG: hypothetical protein IJ849_08980 [Selenomonadaceae bacterium]|nr:hypothetical protein [Selenomonadaceae bacterium]